MITETATVTQVDKNGVTVQSKVKSTCSQCQQVDNCGSGQVAKAIPHQKLNLNLTTDLSLKVGDQVTIAIPENYLLRSAWQVYLWPIIGLMAFAGFGQFFLVQDYGLHELYSIILGGLGGYLGYRLAKFWQNKTGIAEQLMPKIVNKVDLSPTVHHIHIQ